MLGYTYIYVPRPSSALYPESPPDRVETNGCAHKMISLPKLDDRMATGSDEKTKRLCFL